MILCPSRQQKSLQNSLRGTKQFVCHGICCKYMNSLMAPIIECYISHLDLSNIIRRFLTFSAHFSRTVRDLSITWPITRLRRVVSSQNTRTAENRLIAVYFTKEVNRWQEILVIVPVSDTCLIYIYRISLMNTKYKEKCS